VDSFTTKTVGAKPVKSPPLSEFEISDIRIVEEEFSWGQSKVFDSVDALL
jgi:hypothetical protein